MNHLNSNVSGQDPELAPELEWLLQSHQFPPAQVAEALLKACYPDLYRWMLLCLDDEDMAAASALKTILAAAENAYRYPGDSSALVWVFRLGAQEIRRSWRWQGWTQSLVRLLPWQTADHRFHNRDTQTGQDSVHWLGVDELPADHRLAVNLVCGVGWDTNRVGPVLGLTGEQASSLLEQAFQTVGLSPVDERQGAGRGAGQERGESLAASLRRRLAQWSGPSPDLDELAEQAADEFERQARQRSRSVYWKEIFWLAGTAGVIALVLWAVNLWLPEPQSALDPPVASQAGPIPARTPRATSAADETIPVGPIAVYQVQPGDSLGSIASFLGIPLDELRRMNPEVLEGALRPGQTLRAVLRAPEQPVLPTPVSVGDPLITPLDFWITPKDFVDWLIITPARWTTVWLDGLILDYGPSGVIRSPDQTRFQAWISKPDRDLVIRQGPDLSLDRMLTLGEWQYISNPQGEIEIRKVDHRANLRFDVRHLVSPGLTAFVQQADNWHLLRVEPFAGRSAIIADWFPDEYGSQALAGQGRAGGVSMLTHNRIWIDTSSGVILRLQELAGEPDHEILTRELVVNNIQYDRNFPGADRFSPWALNDQAFLDRESGWLSGSEGLQPVLTQTPAGRGRMPLTPPGPGFDPATAQLTLQYRDSNPPYQQQVQADVFAGSAYLGQIVMSDPERMICARSPDGRQIAYTYDPYGNPDIMGIGWFRLEYPLQFNRLEIPLIPDSLAFSPNGRDLAYFASPLHASPGSLAVIDLQTGRTHQLARLIYANSLVWGPEGQSLAMIVADPQPEKREVRIFDVASRTFTYRQKVSIESILNPGLRGPDWPTADWPARDWGVAFPAPEGSLQDCLQP